MDVSNVPIGLFTGNITYGSKQGLGLWYHRGTVPPSTGTSIFSNYTAWSIQSYGVSFLYTHHVTLQNSLLIGNLTTPDNSVYGVRMGIEDMDDVNFTNDTMEGFAIGIRFATVGSQTVTGGFYNNIHNLEVRMADEAKPLTITIAGNVQFGTLTASQLGGRTQYNTFMNSDATLITREDLFPLYFEAQTTNLNTVTYNGKQLYFNEQAANYIPFQKGTASPWVPAKLIGLTNQQLWQQYGIAFAGAVAPSGATSSPRLYGLLGAPTTYSPTYTMVSPTSTTKLKGYQLIYINAVGKKVVDPTLVNLVAGWNLITRTINGVKTTFFVYGGVLSSTPVPASSKTAATASSSAAAASSSAAGSMTSARPARAPSGTSGSSSSAQTMTLSTQARSKSKSSSPMDDLMNPLK